jgi:outer membrane protein OmpA-like peptidoglycan-associated protein
VGTFAYNQQLAAARARTVVEKLQTRFAVAPARLEPHGVGPLTPVFSNSAEAGRDRNRRVELVERPPVQ